jgi:hypothetical protein
MAASPNRDPAWLVRVVTPMGDRHIKISKSMGVQLLTSLEEIRSLILDVETSPVNASLTTMTNADVKALPRPRFALLTLCLVANDLFPSPKVFSR